MFIDTHTHINFPEFNDNYKEVISRALKENIWLINIGSDLANSKRAVEIASGYEKGVYAAVGLHPTNAEDIFKEEELLELAQSERVVAIGETGLDYYHGPENKNDNLKLKDRKENQKTIFLKHIGLAKETNKPLIIHCRDAHDDLLDLLVASRSSLIADPGVMHFFGGAGAWENVKKYLDLGFYISFSGVVTFPKYSHNEDIKKLPIDKILVETDAPYVAPVPFRGKVNEPFYVKYTAQKIADIRGISLEKLAEQTTKNAKKLFKI